MKQIILILFLAVAVISAQAQKISFCDAFILIEKESTNGFKGLNMGRDSTDKFNTAYISSVQIIGANNSKILGLRTNNSFRTDFGIYNSYDEVNSKVNSLCNTLTNCFEDLKFSKSTEKTFNTESYSIYFNTVDGIRVFSARLKVLPLGNRYNLSFEFDGSAEPTALNKNPVQAHVDYKLVNATMTSNDFNMSLRKVLEEAKTGFTAIKGELLPEQKGFFKTYNSKYHLPKFRCHIEERGMGIVNYVIPKVITFTRENSQTAFPEILKEVNQSLGPNYANCSSFDKKSIYYVHKDQPDKKVLSMILNADNDTYSIDLLVHAH